MRARRLLWQLYPTYLAIALLAVVADTWFDYDSSRRSYLHETAADLEARSRLVTDQFRALLAGHDTAAVDPLCKRLGGESDTRITIILPSGRVIGDTDQDPARMENHADRPEVAQAVVGSVGMSMRYSRTLRHDLMYVAVPVLEGGQIAGVVRCSVPLAAIGQVVQAIYRRMFTGALVIAVLTALVSLAVSRRISRPLEEMRSGVEFLARGELNHRLAIPHSAELGSLAEAFNQMAFQLEERVRTVTNQRNEREAILSSMAEGVLAVDTEERIISINQAACRMLGADAQISVGRSVPEAFRHTAIQEFVARVLRADEPIEGDLVLGDPGDRFLHLAGAALSDPRRVRLGAVVVLNDVTRIRRLEATRKEFVANVSHELRTPVTSIKGFVETLQEGAIDNPEQARRFLEIMARQVDRLNLIIEDLLTLSRLEQDVQQRRVHFEEKRLREIVTSAVEVCEPRAAAKGIAIGLHCPEALGAHVNPQLMEQALINLVDNAIKYSEPGSTVRIDAGSDAQEIVISVHDQGCGIPAEHHDRLFERFYRVDRARSRNLGGTGLGLAIVKHIVLVHGGRVAVKSAPGEGSVFSIYLPLAPPPA